jgi:hypothetical protein
MARDSFIMGSNSLGGYGKTIWSLELDLKDGW